MISEEAEIPPPPLPHPSQPLVPFNNSLITSFPTHTHLPCPQVPFKKSFNPKDSMGDAERWLVECEAAMRDSLKDSLRRAFDACAKTPISTGSRTGRDG